EIRRQFAPFYTFLRNKWYFDELYDFIFVRPSLVVSRFISSIDRNLLDQIIDGLAAICRWVARWWDRIVDRGLVDGSVNLVADWLYGLGTSLHRLQTGQLRQYVMFIVVGTIAVFLV